MYPYVFVSALGSYEIGAINYYYIIIIIIITLKVAAMIDQTVVMRNIPSSMIRSLHRSIQHAPEMKINHPKMACSCLCGRFKKKRFLNNGHVRSFLTLWNAFDNVQLREYR